MTPSEKKIAATEMELKANKLLQGTKGGFVFLVSQPIASDPQRITLVKYTNGFSDALSIALQHDRGNAVPELFSAAFMAMIAPMTIEHRSEFLDDLKKNALAIAPVNQNDRVGELISESKTPVQGVKLPPITGKGGQA